jgi:hypothetical protein
MTEGKAFLVVGHENFGKSRTLDALVKGSRRRRASISGRDLFIRSMSNDDRPKSFHRWVGSISPEDKPYVVIAVCPRHRDLRLNATLRKLKRSYTIVSFVLRRAYERDGTISAREIAWLRRFGRVTVFKQRAEAPQRAGALRALIRRHLG